MKAMIVLAALTLGGCSVMPDKAGITLDHISHPLAGWPVSASNTEDGLTQVNALVRWQKGRVYVESGLGYNIQGRDGGGFYGPAVTYTGRIGVDLWCR